MEKNSDNVAKRIIRKRKDVGQAEKEAAVFEEIHKLLEDIDENPNEEEALPVEEVVEDDEERSIIPYSVPWLKIWKEELLFSLFNQESICLKNFIEGENFHTDKENEEVIREVIANHWDELIFERRGLVKGSGLSLYVLYLMSVHADENFVFRCTTYRFDVVNVEDVLPVFRNWGVDLSDLCSLDEEKLLRFLGRDHGNIDKLPSRPAFPVFNIDAVLRTLTALVLRNELNLSSGAATFIRLLGRLLLDAKFVSSGLNVSCSVLLNVVATSVSTQKLLTPSKMADILFDSEEASVLLQVKVCEFISSYGHKIGFLRDYLVLKTISRVLKFSLDHLKVPIEVRHVKSVLRRLTDGDVLPLEFYCVLRLLTGSMTNITATTEDYTELNVTLTRLDSRISQTDDSVDLIRLKREVAKVRTLLSNSRS